MRDDFGQVTYGNFAALTVNFAKNLQVRGVDQTSTVGVVTSDLLVMLTSMLATSLLGCKWLMAGPLNALRDAAGITLLLDDAPNLADRLPGALQLDPSWVRPPEDGFSKPFEGYKSPFDVWIITHTSGTTGTPKLVALSQRCMSLRSKATASYIKDAKRLSGVFPIAAPPLFHRYLAGLLNGSEIVHSRNPDLWESLRVGYIFGSVSQIQKILKDRTFTPKLPRLQLSGGTPHESLVHQFLVSFENVATGYGSTESNQSMQMQHSLDEHGKLMLRTKLSEDVDVECVDEDGNVVPTGEEGIVRIRNPFLASGYYGNKALSDQVFRDGCFYPGDLARWDEAGNFTICGRINDQFNIGGSKMNAALIDQVMLSVADVEDAMSFMFPMEDGPDRLTAFISIKPGAYQDRVISDIKLAITQLGRPNFVPQKFLFAKTLPRTPTGKPDRNACIQKIMERKQRVKA